MSAPILLSQEDLSSGAISITQLGTALANGETLPTPKRPAPGIPALELTTDTIATGPKLILDPTTFGLRLAGGSNSSVEYWNSFLSDLIAEARLGPTMASRAYALLNTVFYDLLVTSSGKGRAVYFDSTFSPPTSLPLLDDLLDQAAQHLLSEWFQVWEENSDGEKSPPETTISQDASSWLGLQLQRIPKLNPYGLTSDDEQNVNLATGRLMEEWIPEHVPIDDPDAPLQQPLTPHWGELEGFSFLNAAPLRPDGPEPFLLLEEDQAWLDFHTGLLHLTNLITLNSSDAEHGLVMDAGLMTYVIHHF